MVKSMNLLNANGDLVKVQDSSEITEVLNSIDQNVDTEIDIIKSGFLVDLQSRENV